MGVTPVEFSTFCKVGEDVGKQVKLFLLGEDGEDSKFERSDSASSSGSIGSEEKFTPNVYLDGKVEEWDDWGEEKPLTSNENDESVWNWLFRCSLETYSDAEYILVSWNSRFVVLQKPPNDEKYKIICKKSIDGEEGVASEITASRMFGLSNSRQTDILDCLIIALGTLDGHVYFYTEKGTLLYFDRFSIYEAVNGLQFESVQRYQVFIVVFSRTFFVINPISLRSALHKAKILIAKGEKTAQEASESIELQLDLIDPDVKSNIINVVFTGLHKPTTLQQYVSASWESFNARVERPVLPTYSTFLVTTEKVFVTFVWYDRDEAEHLWKEAVKYGKSLIPSFGFRKLLGISTEPTRKAAHMHSAQHAPTRSQILDARVAQRVATSPDGRYVAIVDRMARVVVVDILYRTTVLVFKGYRDASISWVSIIEGKRYGQFLAIFAPRRSLLEVWSVLGNVRVCARHVPNSECDLVSGGESRYLCSNSYWHTPRTAFFVDEKGEFHQLVIPFHLALHGRASQDEHDTIVLRNIEKLDINSPQWLDAFKSLKMAKSRRVAFQNAISLLENVEDAHQLLAKVRAVPAAQSLAKIPDKVEKSVVFYDRIMKLRGGDSNKDESERVEELGIDQVVKRIVDCHLEYFRNETGDETLLKLGEWLAKTDLSTEVDPFKDPWTDETRVRLANLIFYPIFSPDVKNFDANEFQDTIVEKLPFDATIVAKLLCLKLKSGMKGMTWQIFERLVRFFVAIDLSLEDIEYRENVCTGILRKFSIDTENISLAILVIPICCCARSQIFKERKRLRMENKLKESNEENEELERREMEEEEEYSDDSSDSEVRHRDVMNPELKHLDSMLMCLHCAALSAELKENDGRGGQPRVGDLALKIDSYCRENVAKWIVRKKLSRKMIEKLYPLDPVEELDLEEETEEEKRRKLPIDWPEQRQKEEEKEEDGDDVKEVKEKEGEDHEAKTEIQNDAENENPDGIEFVTRMSKIISRTFEHDLVVADVCWEMMRCWFREKDAKFSLFEDCTRLLAFSMDDRRLRHGISRLIWDKFVASAFETVVKMVEKTGRIPKEREMRKDVGMSESRVVDFMIQCERLLQILMECVRDTPVAREFSKDVLVSMANKSFPMYLDQPRSAFRKDQFYGIAIKQSLVNFHLVKHHYQLALTIRLQLAVGLRYHPLRSVFCLAGNRAFFVRLDSHPLIPLDRVDDAVLEKRHSFLTKIAEQGTIHERRLAKLLEGEWNLTVNSIALMQAVSSFRLGHDWQGENELVSCVRDDRAASAMLRLLAARMAQLATEEKRLMMPKHQTYLFKMAGDEFARIELADEESDNPTFKPNPKTWFDSVERFSTIIAPFKNVSQQAATHFLRLNDIALQYWGIRWM